MPPPLRKPSTTITNEDTGPEAPESLYLSALLAEGKFLPQRHHLTYDDLGCWHKLWQLCEEHQQHAGVGPSIELVQARFPEFEFIPGVDAGWAASQLHRAAAKRALRSKAKELIKAIGEDDLDTAYELLEHVERHRVVRKPASSLWDHAAVEDFDVSKIPVPYPSLMRVSGGIAPAELWYFAGRPGIGKTFTLCDFSACAAMEGYTLRYASLEMSAAAINKRVRRILAARLGGKIGKEILMLLDSKEIEDFKRGMDMLKEQVPGSVQVVDSSHGRFTNAFVREQMSEGDLVVVDHAGLMWTSDGRKAVDDWRAMAQISNVFREDTVATGTSLLAAVQLNREAEHGTAAPKINTLSQSDALGQDGNVIITARKLSKHCMLMSAEKVREGAQAKWYTRFDPARARFNEVTPDQAIELQSLDEDEIAAQSH